MEKRNTFTYERHLQKERSTVLRFDTVISRDLRVLSSRRVTGQWSHADGRHTPTLWAGVNRWVCKMTLARPPKDDRFVQYWIIPNRVLKFLLSLVVERVT